MHGVNRRGAEFRRVDAVKGGEADAIEARQAVVSAQPKGTIRCLINANDNFLREAIIGYPLLEGIFDRECWMFGNDRVCFRSLPRSPQGIDLKTPRTRAVELANL
jgi:hypothetical protein